eukprot:COSAG03_NODE_4097_length_1687_cov_14.225441_2_plen_46_part_00
MAKRDVYEVERIDNELKYIHLFGAQLNMLRDASVSSSSSSLSYPS